MAIELRTPTRKILHPALIRVSVGLHERFTIDAIHVVRTNTRCEINVRWFMRTRGGEKLLLAYYGKKSLFPSLFRTIGVS